MSVALGVRRTLVIGVVLGLLLIALPVDPVVATEVAPATVSTTVDGIEDRVDGALRPSSSSSRVTDVIAADHPFVGVGIRGAGPAPDIAVRTSDLDGVWGEWIDVGLLDGDDGPDADTAEGVRHAPVRDGGRWTSDAVWVGPSTHVQVTLRGTPRDVQLMMIDTAGLSETRLQRIGRALRSRTTQAPAEASTGVPTIVPRAGWGADESWRSGSTTYRTVRHAVLHHTATTNNYTREQAPQQIRNMYHWHTSGNGWNDLGYNFVIDRFGTMYEGRYGGIERGVQGAHAGGWNAASFGVAIMGNYNDVHPSPEAMDAAARLIAWKYALHGIDPSPTARVTVNDASIRTLEGHRNVRSSYIEWSDRSGFRVDCPGFNISWRMPDLRDAIAAAYQRIDIRAFTDVPAAHPFEAQIMWMADQDISTGWPDRTFRPTTVVSRQAAVSFLYELAGRPPVATNPEFVDVPIEHPFHTAIAWAASEGITEGFPDLTFRPTDAVTRQAAVAFMKRYDDTLVVVDPFAPTDDPIVEPVRFYDVSSLHPFHADIAWAAHLGITGGYVDGSFQPGREVTRQAMAAFLHGYHHLDVG